MTPSQKPADWSARVQFSSYFFAILFAATAFGLAWLDTWKPLAIGLSVSGIWLGWRHPFFAGSVLVATYPILDFTPWSGQWALRHHDFLVTGICCGWWIHRSANHSSRRQWARWTWPIACTAWGCVSALVGWAYLADYADPNAVVQLSPGNAFRVAKGTWLAFAVVFSYPPVIELTKRPYKTAPSGSDLMVSMVRGAPWALIYVGVWCVLERMLFFGMSSTESTYRVAGPMSGAMNLGGQNLESVLLVLLPLTFYGWLTTPKHISSSIMVVSLVLGVAALVLMMTRSAIASLMFVTYLASLLAILRATAMKHRVIWFIGVAVATIMTTAVIVTIPAIWTRFANTKADWQARHKEFRLAIATVPNHPVSWLIGTGSGTYPTAYNRHQQELQPASCPGYFSVTRDSGSPSLLIAGGRSAYLGTQVTIRLAEAAAVRLRLRSESSSLVTVFLCEKNLFSSVACRSASLGYPAGDKSLRSEPPWVWAEAPLVGDQLGQPAMTLGGISVHRPLNLSIGVVPYGDAMEIDEIELLSATGETLWQYSDFAPGLPHWLMTTDFYQPFHIENNLLHLWIEQGAIGLVLLAVAVFRAITNIVRQPGIPAAVLLAVICGPLVAGVLCSTLDTPEAAMIWLVPVFVLASPPRGESLQLN